MAAVRVSHADTSAWQTHSMVVCLPRLRGLVAIPIHCAPLLCFARFDCILLDIMMVRTNGVDVAVALHKAFAGSDTPLPPLIAMTANSSPADAEM